MCFPKEWWLLPYNCMKTKHTEFENTNIDCVQYFSVSFTSLKHYVFFTQTNLRAQFPAFMFVCVQYFRNNETTNKLQNQRQIEPLQNEKSSHRYDTGVIIARGCEEGSWQPTKTKRKQSRGNWSSVCSQLFTIMSSRFVLFKSRQ